jgi:hypothetical protein
MVAGLLTHLRHHSSKNIAISIAYKTSNALWHYTSVSPVDF